MNKHIGHGQRRIKELFSELNKSTPIRVDLIHNKKFQKGFINCSGILVLIPSKGATPPVKMEEKVQVSESKKEPTTKDIQGDSSKVGGKPELNHSEELKQGSSIEIKPLIIEDKAGTLKLTLTSFDARELIDTGSSEDNQDPCMEISIGKQAFKTERQKDAGTQAKFPETFEFIFPVSDFDNNNEVSLASPIVSLSNIFYCF